ncbi:MAG: ABC transporter ATP-binding protein [Oscillospiraceae bacterium]|nr:ABC transporter ATP-binding protein [Oscillospiraceae bacterium]
MIFGKYINRYYIKYAGWLLFGLAALILVDYIQLIVPNLYQQVINGVNQGYVIVDGAAVPFDMDFLLDRICLPMVWIVIAMVFGRFLWRVCIFGAAIKVETNLRNEMFDHAKDLSRQFYQENKVGGLMSLFTNDLETVQECYGFGFLMFFDAVLLGGLSVHHMWRMDPLMTTLAMIPMALLLASSAVVGRYMMKKWDIRQAAFSKLSDFSQESFSGISVIKAFVKESKELLAFRALNRENEEANVDFTRSSVLLRILVTLFVESVVCIILGYGGYLVWRGEFNAGELMEFIGYFNAVIWPIMAVSELIDMTSRGRASLKRISELLDAPQDVADRPDVTPLGPVKGNVEFRHLTFRYPDGEYDALRDVSFAIHAGESVGIVGRTGSGKTTVVDLMLRICNVPDGTVFVDGRDVNTVPIREVRQAAAYVPQDNFLFSDTIARNVDFTHTIPDQTRVVNAAVLAGVADDVRDFPLGYETVLGERGVTVSGGQKQRISIARALIKDAPILILDDSVSAVDTQTERAILQNLRAQRTGRTTILIAHRISTVEQMDRIIFLEDGRVTAIGPHSELYETCPAYHRMVELQKLEEEGAKHNA